MYNRFNLTIGEVLEEKPELSSSFEIIRKSLRACVDKKDEDFEGDLVHVLLSGAERALRRNGPFTEMGEQYKTNLRMAVANVRTCFPRLADTLPPLPPKF